MSSKDKVINNIVITYTAIVLFTYIKFHEFVCIFTYYQPISAANIAVLLFINQLYYYCCCSHRHAFC